MRGEKSHPEAELIISMELVLICIRLLPIFRYFTLFKYPISLLIKTKIMIRTKFALLLTFIGALPLAAQNVRQEKDTVSYMNDDPFNLEQIVVTATRTEKIKIHRLSLR